MPSPPASLHEESRDGLRLLSALEQAFSVWFTDRGGGVSAPPFDSLNVGGRVGDDPAAVATNRERVAAAAGFDLTDLRLARQIHGANVIEVDRTTAPVAGAADVLTTRERGVTIGILTADCTPVVVVGSGAVSIAHAGWRGLVAGAVEAAVAATPHIRCAYVGPSIRACCYEVGPEVIAAFRERDLPVSSADRVDPGLAARAVLERAGVANVFASEECTYCDTRYYSYRRDGVTGRQGAFVNLTLDG